MKIKLVITTDKSKPGGDEIMAALTDEIKALEVGDVEIVKEKALATTLPGLDLQTVTIIVTIVKVSVDIYKIAEAIIATIKENRRRYADKKKVELESIAKNVVILLDGEEKKASLELPSGKQSDEKRFISEVEEMRKKDETRSDSNN